jgi:hypothetical protein
MSRTEAQKSASRLNGSKGTGPVTPRGRLAAGRNAAKHGFSGDGKCLPPALAVEVEADVAAFAAKHRPRDSYEAELVRRAALGNARSRALNAMLDAATDERVAGAVKRWDEARADEVARWAARIDAEPEAALRHLTRFAEGCDYLGDAWESLGRYLEVNARWDEPQARRALRLLGLDADPTPASPDSQRDFWLCVLSLRFEKDPEPLLKTTFRAFRDAAAVRDFLPPPADARAALAQFVRDRVAEFEALGQELWDRYDAPSRASAPIRDAFDLGPEAARLHRYLKDAERLRKHSLDELARLRRDEPHAPPAPARVEPQAASPIPEPTPPPARDPAEAPARNEPGPPPLPPFPKLKRTPLDALCPPPGTPTTLPITITGPS